MEAREKERPKEEEEGEAERKTGDRVILHDFMMGHWYSVVWGRRCGE